MVLLRASRWVVLAAFSLVVPFALDASALTGGAPVQTNATLTGPFPLNKQNEPTIAIDPLNSSRLIAGANDEIDEPACTSAGCPFDPSVGTSGVYRSSDGGATWSQPSYSSTDCANGGASCTIHTLPHFEDLGLISDGDPGIVFGPRFCSGAYGWGCGSIAYYVSLASAKGGSPTELITVSRSTDDGATWSAPSIVTALPAQTTTSSFNDKPAITVDADSSSPFFGSVYVSWTYFKNTGPMAAGLPDSIRVTASRDGGLSWGAAAKLTPSYNSIGANGRQGSVIRTSADGTVNVAWEDTALGSHVSTMMFTSSHDGGLTFGKRVPIAAVSDIPSPLPGASFRTDSFPDMAVSNANGRIYVVWDDFTSGRGKVILSRSGDGGATWSAPITALNAASHSAFEASVAVSANGGHVTVGALAMDALAAGTAPGAGVASFDAYVADSTNGGASFGATVKVSAASSDPDASSTNSLGAQFLGDYTTMIAVPGGVMYIWTDASSAATCGAVDDYRAGTAAKPNVGSACPDAFGNTNILVAAVSY